MTNTKLPDKIPDKYARAFVEETTRLLTDKRYTVFGKDNEFLTEEDAKTVFILVRWIPKVAPTEEKGLTLDEITLYMFHEFNEYLSSMSEEEFYNAPINDLIDRIPREEFLQKKLQVQRSIDFIKKVAIEAIRNDFMDTLEGNRTIGHEIVAIPSYLCAVYDDEIKADVFFDACPKEPLEPIQYRYIWRIL